MEEKERKEIIADAKEAIDKVEDSFMFDKKEAKAHVEKLDDSDLKAVKELVEMLKKPYWKVVLGIIIASSCINICYCIGYLIGQMIAK